jgi:hypothetical protein
MSKKHVSRYFMGAALAAFLSLGAASGCSDNGSTETLRTGDHCGDACERYATCFNTSFDVNACENNCEARLNDSSVTVQTTDDCLNCIGASVCSAATYNCDNLCNSIIIISSQ